MQGNFKNEFKKRLYDFVLRLLKFIESLPKDQITPIISKQVIRSGTSILANYVEGQSASSKKDFINFLTHSLKSSNETDIWLMLLKDTNKGNKNELQWLLAEVLEISKILARSIITSKKSLK